MIHESGSIISSKEVEGELHRLQKGKHFKKEDKEMGKKKKGLFHVRSPSFGDKNFSR